jgi:hypothetical protein
MTTRALMPQERGDLARNTIPHVEWRQALDTFLNTLSSPRTAQVYQRAVIEAMDAIGVTTWPTSPPRCWPSIAGGL